MRILKSKISWGIFILLLNCSSQTDVPPKVRSTAETISIEYIAQHIKILADDRFEGRGIGTPGGRAAAEYIREQMKALNLEPAFQGGEYFQPVSLVNMRTIPDQSEFSFPLDGDTIHAKFADDYIGIANCQLNAIACSGKPVFVGYGIHAPEYGWNDYKDLDCTGKILIGLMNEPPSDDGEFFDGERLTYYGRWSYKYEEGARRGAKAVILIHTDETAGYGWRVISNSNISGRPLIDNEKHENPVLDATYFITGDLGKKLFSSAGFEFDVLFEKAAQPDFEPIGLDTKLTLSLTSEKTAIATQNVVGKITGSDPQLKNEAIILTAHYDHLGIGKPVNGDSIYNGANDNASGVATMLSVAKAMSSLEKKPARSIYFAAVGAEEALLLGSEYLAQHPPIPIENFRCCINYDCVSPRGRTEDVVFLGAEKTLFQDAFNLAIELVGVELAPDPLPKQGFYFRSDQYSFVKEGVPGVWIRSGLTYPGHDLEWGLKKFAEYRKQHYHQPSDEYREDWDLSGAEQLAKAGFWSSWLLANRDVSE